MLPPASSASIQEKPDGSVSSFHSAGCLLVDLVQVLDQPLYAAVTPLGALPPVDAAASENSRRWPNSVPMNSSFLPGMRPHERVERPQGAELAPLVLGRPLEHRALAVHDLVVADRQDEVLRVRVRHRERHLVVVVLPVDRLAAQVAQRVVHPAHVPLEAEAEAAVVDRLG